MSMAGVTGSGAAKRRNNRLLRVAPSREDDGGHGAGDSLHHSAQPAGPVVQEPSEEEVRETHDALRRPKPSLPGVEQSSCLTHWGRKQDWSGRLARAPGFLSSLRSSWCRRLHMTTPRSPSSSLAEGFGGGESSEGAHGVGDDGCHGGDTGDGGGRRALGFGRHVQPHHPSQPCLRVVPGQGRGHEEEGEEEKEEEEEEVEEGAVVPVQLLFMTSHDSFLSTLRVSRAPNLWQSCSVSWRRPRSTGFGFFCEITSGTVCVFSTCFGSTNGTVHASVFGGFWVHFLRDCGHRILRSILGHFHDFYGPSYPEVTVQCLRHSSSTGILFIWC